MGVSVFLVISAGSVGFYVIFGGKEKFIDCVYMTVISITTVGYGEVIRITGNIPAEVFTMFLIIFGMGIILYGISALTATLLYCLPNHMIGICWRKSPPLLPAVSAR